MNVSELDAAPVERARELHKITQLRLEKLLAGA